MHGGAREGLERQSTHTSQRQRKRPFSNAASNRRYRVRHRNEQTSQAHSNKTSGYGLYGGDPLSKSRYGTRTVYSVSKPCELSISLIHTIYVRFNVAYGAPAPREGVQPEEGGTLQGWGYIRVLPGRGYRANSHAKYNNLNKSIKRVSVHATIDQGPSTTT